MINQFIHTYIAQAVAKLWPDQTELNFRVEHPADETHGDYSVNVAMVLARLVQQSPLVVAQQIVDSLPGDEQIESVVAVAPGFINIKLKPSFFLQQLHQVIDQADAYGTWPSDNQQVLFEFGCANTHKIPHIGHLFSYCYGESTARILTAAGHTVHRDNYQGDVGLHVAKCLWAYQQHEQPDPEDLADQVEYLQACYQKGSAAYDADETAKQAIDTLNRAISHKDPAVMPDWEKTRDWSIAYYKAFERRLGVNYDKYYFESQTAEKGLEIVKANIGPIFEEDAGAIIFRGEPFGLHTRVFVNKFGVPTYEAKDVGLATMKKADWQFDSSIYTTAVEQNEYWQVVIKAIELIFPDYSNKIKHIGFGMINLTTGKMSSRSGTILTAFSLVETVKDRVKEYIQANRDYSAQESEKIAEIVAIGAIKYSLLKSAAGKNLTFDIDSSIAFEGNSGPYLQYTYARCQSVLRKAGQSITSSHADTDLNSEELSILRWLYRYSEVVAQSAQQLSPHFLCSFLFELAQRYSYFYNQHQIITDDASATALRLQLTAAVAQVLKNGLDCLGIEVIDQI